MRERLARGSGSRGIARATGSAAVVVDARLPLVGRCQSAVLPLDADSAVRAELAVCEPEISIAECELLGALA